MTSSIARPALGVAVTALAAAITLTACSSSSGNGSSGAGPASPSPAAASPSSGGPAQRGPAAAGTIAAIDGTTMQVQNPQSGQVGVTWTSSTKFSHQVTTTLTAVRAGDCATAIAPSGTSQSATAFTATTVAINPPVGGTCGGGRGPGARPSGTRTGFPSGRPSNFPSGRRSGLPNLGAIATGQVTSVSGSTIVIAARQFGSGGNADKTVTVAASTKLTTEAAATATVLKVGMCATAQGKADSSGTVAATTVRVSDPVNGQCTMTFAGRGNGG